MKTQIPVVFISVFTVLIMSGCGSKLDNFDDIRDFIMHEADTPFRTTIELAIETDNLGVLRNHIKEFDFDTDDFNVSGIEKVEFGVYRVQADRTIQLSDHIATVNVNKMTRRLKRAGYDTIIQKQSEDELSLGLIKETRRSKTGAGYFIQLKPDNFVLIKVDAEFRKL